MIPKAEASAASPVPSFLVQSRRDLQRRNDLAPPNEAPPIVHEVLRAAGQPLERATRSLIEPHFRHDFSQVRVHTGQRAAESVRAVRARAYTVGQHIVFGEAQFAPRTPQGRHLLAHELVHVLQQRDRSSADASLTVGPLSDSHEEEANRIASSILQKPGPVSSPARGRAVSLQRAPTDGGAQTQAPKTPYIAPDPKRFNFCFIMGERGGYYKLGDYFAKTYYSGNHEIIHAGSLCDILSEIRSRVDTLSVGDERKGIGEVVIISHADKEGRFYFPLNEGDATRWVTPDDVAGVLSPGWLEKTGIVCRTDALRVAAIADAATRVTVKGCNLGQNQAAVDAIRQLFGSDATVTAPKLKVELAVIPLGGQSKGRRNPSEVITWLVTNGYLPPEAEQWPADKKEQYFYSLLQNNDASGITGIPMDYLLLPGAGGTTTRIPPSDPRYQQNLATSASSPP